jgi:hypothetical protein
VTAPGSLSPPSKTNIFTTRCAHRTIAQRFLCATSKRKSGLCESFEDRHYFWGHSCFISWQECLPTVLYHGRNANLLFYIMAGMPTYCFISWQECQPTVLYHGRNANLLFYIMAGMPTYCFISWQECLPTVLYHGRNAYLHDIKMRRQKRQNGCG